MSSDLIRNERVERSNVAILLAGLAAVLSAAAVHPPFLVPMIALVSVAGAAMTFVALTTRLTLVLDLRHVFIMCFLTYHVSYPLLWASPTVSTWISPMWTSDLLQTTLYLSAGYLAAFLGGAVFAYLLASKRPSGASIAPLSLHQRALLLFPGPRAFRVFLSMTVFACVLVLFRIHLVGWDNLFSAERGDRDPMIAAAIKGSTLPVRLMFYLACQNQYVAVVGTIGLAFLARGILRLKLLSPASM